MLWFGLRSARLKLWFMLTGRRSYMHFREIQIAAVSINSVGGYVTGELADFCGCDGVTGGSANSLRMPQAVFATSSPQTVCEQCSGFVADEMAEFCRCSGVAGSWVNFLRRTAAI